jgi:large subunit ribosomal protein L29
MMKIRISDVRDMSPLEREQKLKDLKKDLFKLRSSNAMGGTLTDPARIREIRRGIARIKTVQRENNEI